ncbi:YbaB/EbfC DNA-binding family protein [Micromonospora viridifaciens]|uniref:YbaB/EbfC DNA-binding family protein n=1 Tax=Micromonospora viridifaciens TaxID=1881 RepID=A0A1C4Z8G8_MICVI|nr:YbaB/EbfC family nucleoid-associated protein [Micromonospora viridifaciens]SCF29167.1 YbaB/EbfC DNA-binding family protein [Micromonospora viridifaciens]
MFDEDGLERQLREARATLREVAEASRAHDPREIVTEAAEGRIVVTLGTDGRISSLEINPTVLRDGVQYLAEELQVAVNAALDERSADARTDEPVADLAALTARVERLQDEGLRQMRALTMSVSDVMRKLHGR